MLQFITIVLTLFLVFFFIQTTHDSIIDPRVNVLAYDNRYYKVRNTKDKQETANTIAKLNEKINLFINKLLLDTSENDHFKLMKIRLKQRYDPAKLSEGKIDKRYSSYTVNKGEEIVLCLRTRDHKDELYDMNLLFYVILHELGHVASVGEQHDAEFNRNFSYLLRKAVEWNMFQRLEEPFQYCGLHIQKT